MSVDLFFLLIELHVRDTCVCTYATHTRTRMTNICVSNTRLMRIDLYAYIRMYIYGPVRRRACSGRARGTDSTEYPPAVGHVMVWGCVWSFGKGEEA